MNISLSYPNRKNHQRQLEASQQNIEAENKAKNEQMRQRKLMEEQVNDLQSTLEQHQKVIKKEIIIILKWEIL